MTARVLFAFTVAATTLMCGSVQAEPSCTAWLWQSEGNYWQQCVYDDGSRKCFRATDNSGSNAQEISC